MFLVLLLWCFARHRGCDCRCYRERGVTAWGLIGGLFVLVYIVLPVLGILGLVAMARWAGRGFHRSPRPPHRHAAPKREPGWREPNTSILDLLE